MKNVKIEPWQQSIIENSNEPVFENKLAEELVMYLWCKEWTNLLNKAGINGTQIFASVHREKLDLKPFGIQSRSGSSVYVLVLTKDEYANCLPFVVEIDKEYDENGQVEFRISNTARYKIDGVLNSDTYMWQESFTNDLNINDKNSFLNELNECYLEYLEWLSNNIINRKKS